jgi:ABC-2 type transport system permease protein
MIRALRSEWIKIRTTTGNLVLAGLAIGIPLLISTLTAIFGDFEFSDNREIYDVVLGPAFITVFLAGVLGVLCIGQEYRHSTIRTTFSAMPRRSTVYLAKVILTAVMGVVLGAVAIAASFVVTKIIFSTKDITMSMTEPGENLTATVGFLALCGLFSLAGFGVGAIIRQPAGAIPLLLLWPFVVEGLVGGLLGLVIDGVSKYMPFQAGFTLSSTGFNDPNFFSRLPAGLYFGAWVAALVGIGWILVERRDA